MIDCATNLRELSRLEWDRFHRSGDKDAQVSAQKFARRATEYESEIQVKKAETRKATKIRRGLDMTYKFAPRDPENMDPYGPQNHPLPPFTATNQERTVTSIPKEGGKQPVAKVGNSAGESPADFSEAV